MNLFLLVVILYTRQYARHATTTLVPVVKLRAVGRTLKKIVSRIQIRLKIPLTLKQAGRKKNDITVCATTIFSLVVNLSFVVAEVVVVA